MASSRELSIPSFGLDISGQGDISEAKTLSIPSFGLVDDSNSKEIRKSSFQFPLLGLSTFV